MVKGLSRDKLGTVNYYSRKLYHGYLPRLISVFTQLFSRETRQGLLERARFSVLKAVDIQDKKKKKTTQMVQVEFLKIKNQVNKRVNPNSNLPCIKKKCFFRLSGVQANDFKFFLKTIFQ